MWTPFFGKTNIGRAFVQKSRPTWRHKGEFTHAWQDNVALWERANRRHLSRKTYFPFVSPKLQGLDLEPKNSQVACCLRKISQSEINSQINRFTENGCQEDTFGWAVKEFQKKNILMEMCQSHKPFGSLVLTFTTFETWNASLASIALNLSCDFATHMILSRDFDPSKSHRVWQQLVYVDVQCVMSPKCFIECRPFNCRRNLGFVHMRSSQWQHEDYRCARIYTHI